MPKIIVKIPRRKKKVSIIRSKDLIKKEQSEHQKKLMLERLAEQKQKAQQDAQAVEETEAVEESRKSEFIERYIISDSNQPLEISLDNLPEDLLPVEEVKKEVQKSYDRGLADGQDSARATFMAEIGKYQDWVRNIDFIVDDMVRQQKEEINELEESLLYLSMMIAEHILEREISADGNIVIEQTKKAIAALDNETILKIRVNPNDMNAIIDSKSELVSDASKMENVVITGDEDIAPGGCIIESMVGIVDARIRTQLEKLRKSLAKNITTVEPSVTDND